MNIKKIDPIKNGQILFTLDNKAFTRDFDLTARNVQEEVNYLKDCEVYILYDKTRPIGFFAFTDKGEIKTLVVAPEKQHQGYGKILMGKIFELNKKKKIYLVTHPQNSNALVFYLKSGFEIYGWKDNYYGDGQPRLLLQHFP